MKSLSICTIRKTLEHCFINSSLEHQNCTDLHQRLHQPTSVGVSWVFTELDDTRTATSILCEKTRVTAAETTTWEADREGEKQWEASEHSCFRLCYVWNHMKLCNKFIEHKSISYMFNHLHTLGFRKHVHVWHDFLSWHGSHQAHTLRFLVIEVTCRAHSGICQCHQYHHVPRTNHSQSIQAPYTTLYNHTLPHGVPITQYHQGNLLYLNSNKLTMLTVPAERLGHPHGFEPQCTTKNQQ